MLFGVWLAYNAGGEQWGVIKSQISNLRNGIRIE